MVLDHAGVAPNPARDRVRIRLPHERRPEIAPPAAEHVLAVHALLPSRYRLPLLVLEHLRGVPWARIGELVGQRNLAVTANTYTHVLTDEAELDYSELLAQI